VATPLKRRIQALSLLSQALTFWIWKTRSRTRSLRRTKVALIYRRTGNFRTVQLLLGHTKLESRVRYLGIEVDDAQAIAQQIDM
jgi:integrase